MSGKMVNIDGIPIHVPNDIVNETPEFYISFNECTRDYGSITTALVLQDNTKFLILNGNHTENYNEIISNGGTYTDCVKYYRDNIQFKSKFSEG